MICIIPIITPIDSCATTCGNSHSSDTVNSKKGFFSLLLSQLFHGEPKNRDELLALIRDSGQNDLIDEDTRDMLEGVMDIADQRVRDIMIDPADSIQ